MHAADFNDRLMGIAADGALLTLATPDHASRADAAAVAPLVQCLREQVPAAGDGLWLTVPPVQDAAHLGAALQQLRGAGYFVHGFVDRAAVLSAWLQGTGNVAVLDLSRTCLDISLVVNDGAAAALRRTVHLPGGEAALHAAWLQLAAATLVQTTRFDPLHDQRHEAQLRQRLPALAAAAQLTGQGSCTIDTAASQLSLTLTRDQLVEAASPWLQPLAAALQALSAATDDCALLVPPSLLEIPGLTAVLMAARFGTAWQFGDGDAARAASLLAPVPATTSGAVQYLTRLPVFTAAQAQQPVALQLDDGVAPVMATHVVYRGRALAIAADGLVIGRDPGEGGVLQLPEGIAGLSRRHCTLRRDDARTYIVDHSTYGSYVDGVRVRGRALLAAGSTLQLGLPGIELPLVALDAAPTAAG
jgi:FHA domain